MTQAPNLSPEDAALEQDPTFRREVVDAVLDTAESRGIHVDTRCRRLLEQYADGKISCIELDREVGRPIFH